MAPEAPPSWRPTALADVGAWVSGGTPKTSVARYWGGDIPWISASSLRSFYLASSERRVTEAGLANGTRLVPAGAVVFVVRGMSLKSELRVGLAARPLAFGQDCKAIVPRPDVDSVFLANVLRARSREILALVDEASHGTGRLQTRALERFVIALPPLDEQRRVAEILGALEDKIALDREMNATLEETAQAIVRAALPGEDALRVALPRGWVRTTLGAWCDESGGSVQTGPFGSQLHAADYVGVGVPCVMPTNLERERVSAAGIARVRVKDAERLAKHRVEVGDILHSRRGDVERRALVSEREAGWLCGTGCLRVRLGGSRADAHYLYRYLGLPEVRAWIVRHAHGATMANLNTAILRALPVLRPPERERRALARTLVPLFERREANCAESTTLAEIRDTLLPKLVSGELRVGEAEADPSARRSLRRRAASR